MTFDLDLILQTLASHGVEFILVGGVAAAVHGAPVVTQDVDILYRIERDNLHRLLGALEALDAVARHDPRRLRFGIEHLESKGYKLSMTRAGALDILGSINDGLTYEDLWSDAEPMQFDQFEIYVLRLERLLELKRQLARPKDLAIIPLLEATLRERSRS